MILASEYIKNHLYLVGFQKIPYRPDCDSGRFQLRESENSG